MRAFMNGRELLRDLAAVPALSRIAASETYEPHRTASLEHGRESSSLALAAVTEGPRRGMHRDKPQRPKRWRLQQGKI